MKNTIDLTKLLTVGDKVWSNVIGDTVEIIKIEYKDGYLHYALDELETTFCTDRYGHVLLDVDDEIITDDAIPDLVPSKGNWDWSTFKRKLPVDTFCVVSDDKTDWCLRYYAGNGKVFVDGKKSKDDSHTVAFSHIIPVDKFNFENLSFAVTDDYGYNK